MDLEYILYIVLRISSISILIPLVVGILKYRTFKIILKVLFYYIVLATFVEALSIYLSEYKINNLFLSHICVFIEFCIFSFIYLKLLVPKPNKNLLIVAILIFLGVCLIDVIKISGYEKMNELSRNVEGIVMITLALIYFNRLIKGPATISLESQFGFWFNTAIIVYISGIFFLFLFSNKLLNSEPETFYALYSIHAVFLIIFNILLAISLTKRENVS